MEQMIAEHTLRWMSLSYLADQSLATYLGSQNHLNSNIQVQARIWRGGELPSELGDWVLLPHTAVIPSPLQPASCGLWDLSFETRDWTQAPAAEAASPNHWAARELLAPWSWARCTLPRPLHWTVTGLSDLSQCFDSNSCGQVFRKLTPLWKGRCLLWAERMLG